ncbi:MAG: hypothetical protein HXY34_13820 [Candidatus Thorarchaeota archaeon]|nr:hypothetical protein [Candidatus Thorarchaeota archaeon]
MSSTREGIQPQKRDIANNQTPYDVLEMAPPSALKKRLAFVEGIADMCRRGDFDAIADSLKEFWKDKKVAPWHRVYSMLESSADAFESQDALSETLLLLRDSVFGVIGAHSLSLALDISGRELLSIVLSGKTMSEGRRKAREKCAEMVAEKISKKKTDFLLVSGLTRDGFHALVPALRSALLDEFRAARPEPKNGKVSLVRLLKSSHGSELLRTLAIHETEIAESDQRFPQILEAFDRMSVELELEPVEAVAPVETLQATLDGDVIDEEEATVVPADRGADRPRAGKSSKKGGVES